MTLEPHVTRAVVAAMSQHLANAQVQYTGCYALRSFAFKHEANRQQIADGGGAAALLDALRVHAGSARVAEPACAALASLAVDASIAAMIKAMGAVESCDDVLRLHPDSEKVQEAAQALLGNVRLIAV